MRHVGTRPATFVPAFKLLIFNTYVYGQINRCKFIRRSPCGSSHEWQGITHEFGAISALRQPGVCRRRVKVPRRGFHTYNKGITPPS